MSIERHLIQAISSPAGSPWSPTGRWWSIEERRTWRLPQTNVHVAGGLNRIPVIGGRPALPFVSAGAAAEGKWVMAAKAFAVFVIAAVAIVIAVLIALIPGGQVGTAALAMGVAQAVGSVHGRFRRRRCDRIDKMDLPSRSPCMSESALECLPGMSNLSALRCSRAGPFDTAFAVFDMYTWAVTIAKGSTKTGARRLRWRLRLRRHRGRRRRHIRWTGVGYVPWNWIAYAHDMAAPAISAMERPRGSIDWPMAGDWRVWALSFTGGWKKPDRHQRSLLRRDTMGDRVTRKATQATIVGGVIVLGAMAGLLLEDLDGARPVRAPPVRPQPTRRRRCAAARLARQAERARTDSAAPGEGDRSAPGVDAGEHAEAAEGVHPGLDGEPPRPDRNAQPPPSQVPPPNPQIWRIPSMHNPGGVNGDRPPRPIPGL